MSGQRPNPMSDPPTPTDRVEHIGPKLGPCCMCDGDGANNILMLNRRAAMPGRGWGCVVCGLPQDGACAVLCDGCFERYRKEPGLLKVACRGYPASDGRIAIAELPPGPFVHDNCLHEEAGL